MRAPAGDNVIRFTYTTPGLYAGVLLTLGAALLLVIYLLLWKRYGQNARRPAPPPLREMTDELAGGEPAAEWKGASAEPPEGGGAPGRRGSRGPARPASTMRTGRAKRTRTARLSRRPPPGLMKCPIPGRKRNE